MNRTETYDRLHALGRQVPGELLAFGQALYDADRGPEVDGWRYFLERPEKWADEHDAWQRLGRPTPGDLQWGAFCEALDEADRG